MAARRKTQPVPEPQAPAFDLLKLRREICCLYVRQQKLPERLRIYDYLPLYKLAQRIRIEMREAGAFDTETEKYVAKHVISA